MKAKLEHKKLARRTRCTSTFHNGAAFGSPFFHWGADLGSRGSAVMAQVAATCNRRRRSALLVSELTGFVRTSDENHW
jgi:hypothetical protein